MTIHQILFLLIFLPSLSLFAFKLMRWSRLMIAKRDFISVGFLLPRTAIWCCVLILFSHLSSMSILNYDDGNVPWHMTLTQERLCVCVYVERGVCVCCCFWVCLNVLIRTCVTWCWWRQKSTLTTHHPSIPVDWQNTRQRCGVEIKIIAILYISCASCFFMNYDDVTSSSRYANRQTLFSFNLLGTPVWWQSSTL